MSDEPREANQRPLRVFKNPAMQRSWEAIMRDLEASPLEVGETRSWDLGPRWEYVQSRGVDLTGAFDLRVRRMRRIPDGSWEDLGPEDEDDGDV